MHERQQLDCLTLNIYWFVSLVDSYMLSPHLLEPMRGKLRVRDGTTLEGKIISPPPRSGVKHEEHS